MAHALFPKCSQPKHDKYDYWHSWPKQDRKNNIQTVLFICLASNYDARHTCIPQRPSIRLRLSRYCIFPGINPKPKQPHYKSLASSSDAVVSNPRFTLLSSPVIRHSTGGVHYPVSAATQLQTFINCLYRSWHIIMPSHPASGQRTKGSSMTQGS